MFHPQDLVIENGVLQKYTGPGGTVVLPNGLREIGNDAFSGRRDLEADVVIPEGVEKIGESAFYDCIKLRSVTLPESLCTIEMLAFLECRGLLEITIPQNVGKIGCWAFLRCAGLQKITLSGARTGPDVKSQDPFEDVDAPIVAPNMPLGDLPTFWKPRAVWGFALEQHCYSGERQGEYLKYIKSQRKRLYPLALRRQELLLLMCGEGVILPKDVQALLAEADRQGNAAAKEMILAHQ
jgi:hypothetical protein